MQDPSPTANPLMKMCGTVCAVITGVQQSQISPITQHKKPFNTQQQHRNHDIMLRLYTEHSDDMNLLHLSVSIIPT